jgi:hypothetical protein
MGVQDLYRKRIGDKVMKTSHTQELIQDLEILLGKLKAEQLRVEFGLDEKDNTRGLGYEALNDDDGYTD